MKNYNLLQQRYMLNTYVNRGLTFIKGEGIYLYDDNNTQYLDLMSNYGVNIFGYDHPVITKTLQEQISKLITLHGSFANDIRAEAAFSLIKKTNSNLHQVYFSNSGAEAIEAALKFAVLATRKKHIIAVNNSYHGKTFGALSATSGEKYRKPFETLLWDVSFVDFNTIDQIEDCIYKDTAAVIIEPIQGEGGIILPSQDYLQELRHITQKNNVLLILDEIQTGCGRTGTFLASQPAHIEYDIITLGKGLAGGLPVGATLVSKDIAEQIPKQIQTSTFGGNPLTCAGILATLQLLDEARLQHITETGEYFMNALQTLTAPLIKQIRGKGLMIGLEVNDKRNEILKGLQHNHILAIPAGENVVRFLPPYIIEKEQIDTTISMLQRILK